MTFKNVATFDKSLKMSSGFYTGNVKYGKVQKNNMTNLQEKEYICTVLWDNSSDSLKICSQI